MHFLGVLGTTVLFGQKVDFYTVYVLHIKLN